MPSARVVFDWGKERPLISGYSGHAFSVAHLPDRTIERYQGGRADNGSAGELRGGMVDISCWISRAIVGEAYQARLRIMQDMVQTMWDMNQTFAYANIYAATAGTASATGRLVFGPIEFQPSQQDGANHDLFRIRGVAEYQWIRRQ